MLVKRCFEKSIREKTFAPSKKSAGRLRYITKGYLKKLLRLLIYQYPINKDIPYFKLVINNIFLFIHNLQKLYFFLEHEIAKKCAKRI